MGIQQQNNRHNKNIIMKYKKITDADIKGKRVLVRVDYNVPLKDGKIVDDYKIRESLKTIKYLIKNKAKVVIISHLGRPIGLDEKLRMRPVAERVSKLLGKKVQYAKEYIGPIINKKINKMHPGEVMLLENIRFNEGEEFNDKIFSKKLAGLCDVYVNDAFAVSHREQASVVGVTKHVPSYAGLLLDEEVSELSKLLRPKKPFIVILGGAKLSTKLKLIKSMLKTADKILIGGAMAFTFFKAKGAEVGTSLVEEKFFSEAKKLLKDKKIILPIDFIVAENSESKKGILVKEISKDMMGLDIGEETTSLFAGEIKKAKSIFWNGPMGCVENKAFAEGTYEIAREIAKMKNKATTIVGGGDTVKIIDKLGLMNKYTFVSTGGGASTSFLAGEMPGLKALEENCKKFKTFKKKR